MNIADETTLRNHLTFSKNKAPMLGALMDYIETTYLYVRGSSSAENFHVRNSKAKLSATFLTGVCLALGLACSMKFEVVTVDDEPMARDLHLMLMSDDEKLYIDDVDLTRKLILMFFSVIDQI
ncbi:hypothetical protein EVAR_31121_1 [Eumeta japonica]|uniref:Uncharacterized protein n=1 Tax=Eumeta variegata TaxID=151549 RepID=A0A4C1VF47_EUMVA|nr:hypothetical protein EVAR_31121_1 [Eumeta japonica]